MDSDFNCLNHASYRRDTVDVTRIESASDDWETHPQSFVHTAWLVSVKSTLAEYKQREDSLSSMFVIGTSSALFFQRIRPEKLGFLFIDSCSLYNAIFAPLMRMRHYKILERVSFFKSKIWDLYHSHFGLRICSSLKFYPSLRPTPQRAAGFQGFKIMLQFVSLHP